MRILGSNAEIIKKLLFEVEVRVVENVKSMRSTVGKRLQDPRKLLRAGPICKSAMRTLVSNDLLSRANFIESIFAFHQKEAMNSIIKEFDTVFSAEPAKAILERCTIKLISKHPKAHKGKGLQWPK